MLTGERGVAKSGYVCSDRIESHEVNAPVKSAEQIVTGEPRDRGATVNTKAYKVGIRSVPVGVRTPMPGARPDR